MRTLPFIPVLLVLFIAGAVVADDPAIKEEIDKLQGTWLVVAAERDGKKQSDTDFKGMKMIFRMEKVILKDGDKEQSADFTLDPAKKPKVIDMAVKSGDKLDTVKGIYELKGDDLKICATIDRGKERPMEFVTKSGSGCGILTLKREKLP